LFKFGEVYPKKKFFFFGNIKTRVASEDFRFSACEKSDFSHYPKKESFDLRLPINNHSQSSEGISSSKFNLFLNK